MEGQGEGSVKVSFDALGANAEIAIAKGVAPLWINPGPMLAEEHCAALRAKLGCPKPIHAR